MRRPETAHVECERVLRDDKEYVKKISKNRTTLVAQNISMTCDNLRRRIIPSGKLRPLNFGVAYARIVYESYEFIEDELRSSYHPQNVFCYSVDRKANANFNKRIKTLAKCFPNVVVTKARFDIDSAGHFMNHAHYECLKLLANISGWGYVLLMQNYDVMIKTVYETVAILEKLDGANDVHIRPCEPGRWNRSYKWDARSLRLYRDEKLATPAQLNASLTFARGAVHASLSRAAVHWMVKIVDLSVLLDQLNIKAHAIDEILIPTLQVSDIFDMPGRFTAECVKRGNVTGFITRIEVWIGNKMCQSGRFRHAVCIYGIEDFSWLSRHPKIIANKMMPDFDYAIVDCMHELIFNRTHLGQANDALNLTVYENQPYVSLVDLNNDVFQFLYRFYTGVVKN
ncbi:Core-2/I-Branching enzyme [Ancylostoma ceylanicum]|uniref:Core-2/I-Branching enzyme n=1 Tax=Ancylostoma ceylanicum TaxID=53326 RepID=A0A0D6LCK7_9BILA|nr:Core-2/I-Branching enzyme [Ancylostoma ceylanicum]